MGFNSDDKIKSLTKVNEIISSLAIGVSMFLLSSMFFNNGNLNVSFILWPQSIIYLLLGFFHGYNIWNLKDLTSKDNKGIPLLIAYTLMYTAWYNIILLPVSGIGIMEWIIVSLILIPDCISQILGKNKGAKTNYVGQRPMFYIFTGIVLFLAKIIVFFMFSGNIYDEMILGNATAQKVVVFFAAFGFIILFIQLVKKFDSHVPLTKEEKNKTLESIKGFFLLIGSILFKFFKALMKVLRQLLDPIVLIAIAGGIILITIGFSFYKLNGIYHDIENFIRPVLQKLTSTGENLIVPSVPYYLLQTLSMFVILLFNVNLEENFKKDVSKNINRLIEEKNDSISDEDRKVLKGKFEEISLNDQIKVLSSKKSLSEENLKNLLLEN